MTESYPLCTKRAFTAIILGIVIVLSGCGREEREDTRSAEELYAAAHSSLQGGNYQRAVELYRQLNTRYPFGRHAEQAQLDMAYAFYKARKPDSALSTLDRFIRTYPTHPNVDYAWYLKGLTHYQESQGFLRRLFPSHIIDRDQTSARNAFDNFNELLQRHPESRYVPDARQRMVYLRNILADYEITVAHYYQRRDARIAALGRAEYVLENYPGAPAVVEALEIMIECYDELGMQELAADTRRVLEMNYPDRMFQKEDKGFWGRLWPFN